MAADHFLECSNWKEPCAGTIAGIMASLKTGRLKSATSRIESSVEGAEAVERVLRTKLETLGPSLTARVLVVIIATFLTALEMEEAMVGEVDTMIVVKDGDGK